MEAIPSFSVLSLRQLGGAPGQRLKGYHLFEGSIVFGAILERVYADMELRS
jgi:hypothetical protein